MIKQHLSIKGKYPDAILFYESPIPMCGILFRAAQGGQRSEVGETGGIYRELLILNDYLCVLCELCGKSFLWDKI